MLLVFLAAAANAFLALLLLQASQTQRERSDTASKALDSITQRFGSAAAAVAMAAAVLTTPTAAMADLVQTVPVSQMTQMAKPLPKQTIDKSKVCFLGL